MLQSVRKCDILIMYKRDAQRKGKVKNMYCAGTLTCTEEDFYYDTQFTSYEECVLWAYEHNCTHVYNTETEEFILI